MEKIQNQLICFFITFFLVFIVFNIFFSFSKVSGTSMVPSYSDGDITLSISSRVCSPDINRGDVVNVYSEKLNTLLIKRVIAIGGDTVEYHDNKLYINETTLNEDYILSGYNYAESEAVQVPYRYIYVLGDNRNNSTDSRVIGSISNTEITGKILGKVFYR